MRQVKLLKVSFPILTLLVMVLAIAGRQQLIARADTGCSGRCPFRAGYVANSSTINTYDYVESTFTLPLPASINHNSGNIGSKFSMSVGLGDDHLGSPNWASAGIEIQVEANGQIDQPTSFWSVTDGSNSDSRGQGSGHGFFPTNVKVNSGDTIFASVKFDPSSSQVNFFMHDLSNSDTNTNQDSFSLTMNSGQPDGKTAGCFLLFDAANGPSSAYPDSVNFTGCKVGASHTSISQTNPVSYNASGLSNPVTLNVSNNNGDFTISWHGPANIQSSNVGLNQNGACPNGSCQRAGYVAQGGSGTYKYVESTFILPKNQDISKGKDGQFSLGVGLDSNSGSPRWASAGVNFQVTNGQVASPTAFWSVTDGANIRDTRGEGSGHGFFRSTVQVQPGDKILASVQLQGQGQIIFTMDDKTNGGSDKFTLNLDDSSKQPDGSMAGCFLFFSTVNGAQSINGLSYPRKTRFSGCKVGADQGSAQTIDKTNPSLYAVSGLSNTPNLTSPRGGNFTINWNGSGTSRVLVGVQGLNKVR